MLINYALFYSDDVVTLGWERRVLIVRQQAKQRICSTRQMFRLFSNKETKPIWHNTSLSDNKKNNKLVSGNILMKEKSLGIL